MDFTTIIVHDIKKKLKLTCNEYCICDLIYWQQQAEGNEGWCRLSRSDIADMMGITKQATIKILEKLILLNIIKKSIKEKYLQTGEAWNEKFIADTVEKYPTLVSDIWKPDTSFKFFDGTT